MAGQVEARGEIAELRAEQRTQIAEVRTEIANLDTRLSTQIAGARTETASLGGADSRDPAVDGRIGRVETHRTPEPSRTRRDAPAKPGRTSASTADSSTGSR